MSGWMSGGGAARKRARKAGARGLAFADDWMEYENDRARGNDHRQQQQQQQPTQSNHPVDGGGGGGGRMRRPAVPGQASNVAPYSPHGSRGGGGGGVGGLDHSSRSNNNSRSSYSNGNRSNDRLDPSKILPSLSNPSPTVTIASSDAAGLSPEQRHVVEAVLSGYSTFFTGPAGSGKSHVLATIARLNEEATYCHKKRIVITATTGISACNVGGITINSFAGVGTGDSKIGDLYARVMGNEFTKRRWRECDVLVVDEVSMMAGDFLDKLNLVAQRARNNPSPFGGLQLLLCGDFFQLPPVNLKKNCFAFEAKCWGSVIQCSILLKQIFRQNGDPKLMKILNEARVGELSPESAQILRTHSMVGGLGRSPPVNGEEEIKPTLLECRNAQVDRANKEEMQRLPGEVRAFHAQDKGMTDVYKKQLQHCQAPELLELKVGAQVILLKNLEPDKGLVNGSRGVVTEFRTAKNKSDLPREFRQMELPVVRFDAIEGPGSKKSGGNDDDEEGGVLKLIEPAEWSNKIADVTVSSRQQIPLRLAWALSVHKSQGMTIPNLAVSLRGVFEYGQSYVALSRATKLDLLTLRGFDEKAFRAHPKVKEFYRLLENGGTVLDGSNDSQKPANPALNRSSSTAAASRDLNGRNLPQSAAMARIPTAPASSKSSAISPQITDEQRQRMEDNRRRALARKQQKQQQQCGDANAKRAPQPSHSASAVAADNSEGNGSRFFAKTTPPNIPNNPYLRR